MNSPQRKQKVPVPARFPLPEAIELHNLFLRNPLPAAKKWFRHEYKDSLLYKVQLELFIRCDESEQQQQQQQQQHDESTKNGSCVHGRRLIYQSASTSRTMCPTWRHLTESQNINYDCLSADEYKSICARFSVPQQDTNDSNNNNNNDNNNNAIDGEGSELNDDMTNEESSVEQQQQQQQQRSQQSPSLEVLIHPSKLIKIGSVPPNLPINCIVVHFTDGTIRVQPSHYQILYESKQEGVVLNSKKPTISQQSSFEEDSRFGDEVFSALDAVAPSVAPQPKLPASLFPNNNSNNNNNNNNEASTNNGHDENLRNGITSNGDSRMSKQSMTLNQMDASSYNEKNGTKGGLHGRNIKEKNSIDNIDSELKKENLMKEKQLLEQLIQEEELALQQEIQNLEDSKAEIKSLVESVQKIEGQNRDMKKAVQAERNGSQRTEFLVEFQRVRLIRELSTIYSVTTMLIDRRYTIRGIEIPMDIRSGNVPDDDLSAALGFLCHLVHMLSKYLGVHLRYQLICFSSRSRIQNERGTTYPLYQARGVEREQLEYGVHLLDCNVDCLCKARGLWISNNIHVLAKIKRIYESVLEGY